MYKMERQTYQDEATLYRDTASIASLEDREAALDRRDDMMRRKSAINTAQAASANMLAAHERVKKGTSSLNSRIVVLTIRQEKAQVIDEFLYHLMTGKVSIQQGDEQIVKFLWKTVRLDSLSYDKLKGDRLPIHLAELYLHLQFGGNSSVEVPALYAGKLWPKEYEDFYIQVETDRVLQAQTEGDPRWRKTRDQIHQEMEKRIRGKISCRERPKKRGLASLDNSLPKMPPRRLTAGEKEFLIKMCREELAEEEHEEIAKLIRFCTELAKPINHVRTRSGHYVDKEVNTRQVSDMTNEMVQELVNLPRFTSYAKVLTETDGTQTVGRHKIRTPDPREQCSEEDYEKLRAHAIHCAKLYGKDRNVIEQELWERQEAWRRKPQPKAKNPLYGYWDVEEPPADEPPPTSI